MTQLEQLKILTNETNEDLLNLLIEKAIKEVELYTKKSFDVEKMGNVVVDMVVEKLNKRNNEGILSFNINGISENIKDGYSKVVLAQLNNLKKRVYIL